ncbi:hypothetical protein [Pseudomonas sp. MWU12-2323]|nr:hypothetical protein [Pseudomonas sp. MWU12-2323]
MSNKQPNGEESTWDSVFNPGGVLGAVIGGAGLIATLGHIFGWWTIPL